MVRTHARPPRTGASPSLPGRLLLAAALLVGLAVAEGSGATPAAAAPTRTYGSQPIDDIMATASAYASCPGLSQTKLAAMMMTPTFTETGAAKTNSPSPMTMSRWDTQSALWAFGDPQTAYAGAFFSPGVGLWQFDSAGSWPLTAGTAINTQTSSVEAAKVMSSRYCASTAAADIDRMRYAWGPWRECTSGTLCVDIYNEIISSGSLFLNRMEGITRYGGALPRTCRVESIGTLPCLFVNPALAQGDKAWASTNSIIPTPLTKPFYVFEANGREYRYWLAADSGYDRSVLASKPVKANARTSLSWAFVGAGTELCDTDVDKGSCAWSGWTGLGTLSTGDRALAVNADGRLETLLAGADGHLYNAWQIVPNGGWVGPAPLAAIDGVKWVAASRDGAGALHAFALDVTGTVRESRQGAGGWSAWVSLGGGIAGPLDAGTNVDGRVEVFGRNAAGEVTHQWQLPGGGWSGWYAMGSGPVSSVRLSANADGRLEVFAVTGAGVVHSWQLGPNASFSTWALFPGPIAGRVSVVHNVDGRMELFARRADGGLVHAWQVAPNSFWAPLERLGTDVLSDDPAAARNRDGRLEVFGRRPDGSVANTWQLAAGSPWAPLATLGGPPLQAPFTVGNMADGHLTLLARLADGRLAVDVQTI